MNKLEWIIHKHYVWNNEEGRYNSVDEISILGLAFYRLVRFINSFPTYNDRLRLINVHMANGYDYGYQGDEDVPF